MQVLMFSICINPTAKALQHFIEVVNDLSFSLRAGRCYGLLGPNRRQNHYVEALLGAKQGLDEASSLVNIPAEARRAGMPISVSASDE